MFVSALMHDRLGSCWCGIFTCCNDFTTATAYKEGHRNCKEEENSECNPGFGMNIIII